MSAKIKALVLNEKGGEQIVKEVDKPTPKSKPNAAIPGELGELLVKVKTVALNPVDWQQADSGAMIDGFPVTLGADAAGIVEAVGEGVTEFSVGDEVMAFTKLGVPGGYGAFSEYALFEAATTMKKPSFLSWEQAASVPVGSLTAALGLYNNLKLPLPTENPSWFREEYILIWGGSSSVGSYAVQLAAITGLTVIATASPRNHDYLRSIGAAHVIDYNAPDVADKINSITNNSLKYVFDAIGPQSCNIGLKVLAKNGKIAWTAGGPTDKRDDVQESGVALGMAHKDTQGSLKTVKRLAKMVEQIISEGGIRPNNVEVIEGGLSGIPVGLQKLKEGSVSGKKLIAKIN